MGSPRELPAEPDLCQFGLGGDFDTALAVTAQGKSVAAAACLSRLDEAPATKQIGP